MVLEHGPRRRGTTLGDMWVKADTTTVKAGKVTFAVKHTGATMPGHYAAGQKLAFTVR